tara:strand:+ start:2852 stop:2989 length:138 start_codon:yes stop_codon:yes gene_type:complete
LAFKNKLSYSDAIDFQIQFQKKEKSVLTGVLLAVLQNGHGRYKFL